jgi:hypothetical protein
MSKILKIKNCGPHCPYFEKAWGTQRNEEKGCRATYELIHIHLTTKAGVFPRFCPLKDESTKKSKYDENI